MRQRTQNEFLARLSHELRTPLNAVIGFSELLAAQELAGDSSQSRYVEHILEAGRHLLSLVDDVLDLQRVADRKIPLTPRPLELASFIASETTLLQPLLKKQNLTLINDVPAGLMVSADVRCLRQALLTSTMRSIHRPQGWCLVGELVAARPAVLKISDPGTAFARAAAAAVPAVRPPRHETSSIPARPRAADREGLIGTCASSIRERVGVGTSPGRAAAGRPHSLFGDLDASGSTCR